MAKGRKKMFRKKKTIFTRFLKFIRGFDMYGKDIVLTYKGDDKFRTHIGGVASIIVGVVILTYLAYLFQIMFTKADTKFSTSSLLNDVINDVDILQPAKETFDFAFDYSANGIDYLTEPSYFSFSLRQIKQKWVTVGNVATTDRERIDIPYSK
jgi:hypothetical protein